MDATHRLLYLLIPAVNCSIQACGSQKEPAEGLELPPAKRSFGAVPAASSWFQASIWAHLAFLGEGSHCLEWIWIFLNDLFSLRKALSELQPTRQGQLAWGCPCPSPGGFSFLHLGTSGWLQQQSLCTLAAVADPVVSRTGTATLTHPGEQGLSRELQAWPSPGSAAWPQAVQHLQTGVCLVQVTLNLPVSTCQINHVSVAPKWELCSKMRVVLLTYELQKCRRLWLNNLPY